MHQSRDSLCNEGSMRCFNAIAVLPCSQRQRTTKYDTTPNEDVYSKILDAELQPALYIYRVESSQNNNEERSKRLIDRKIRHKSWPMKRALSERHRWKENTIAKFQLKQALLQFLPACHYVSKVCVYSENTLILALSIQRTVQSMVRSNEAPSG